MSERSNISATAFDGEAAWAALPPHAQARIGAFALELGVALGIGEHATGPAQRAGEAAALVAGDLLREAVIGYDGVPEPGWWEGTAEAGVFRLPACLPVCRTCGCSHHDPCEQGCGWAEDGLCTACAESPADAGVEAAAVPDLSHTEARAVVKGACEALGDSDIRGLPPVGRGLGALARALDTMHLEEGSDD